MQYVTDITNLSFASLSLGRFPFLYENTHTATCRIFSLLLSVCRKKQLVLFYSRIYSNSAVRPYCTILYYTCFSHQTCQVYRVSQFGPTSTRTFVLRLTFDKNIESVKSARFILFYCFYKCPGLRGRWKNRSRISNQFAVVWEIKGTSRLEGNFVF